MKKDEFSKRTECKENKNTIKAHMPVKNTNNDTNMSSTNTATKVNTDKTKT